MSEERRGLVEHSRRIVRNLSAALVVTTVLMLGYVTVIASYQFQKIIGVANDTRRNSDRLVDCTTPGGKCYEQGRSTTSGAVGSINRVTIAAIYCSGKLGPSASINQLNMCVVSLVK
jgi:hypothetical protein